MDDKVKTAAAGALTVAADVFMGVTGAGAIKSAYEVYALLAGKAADARLRAAVDGLLAEVANLTGYEEQEREHRFIDLMTQCKPEVEDLIWEMHRTIFFGRSSAARPYVLRLTADRVVNHQGVPDTFSRRAAWLLQRCEEEDLALIGEALAVTMSILAENDASALLTTVWWAFDGSFLVIGTDPRTADRRVCEGRASSDTARRSLAVLELVIDSRIGFGIQRTVRFDLVDGHPLQGGDLDRLIRLLAVRA